MSIATNLQETFQRLASIRESLIQLSSSPAPSASSSADPLPNGILKTQYEVRESACNSQLYIEQIFDRHVLSLDEMSFAEELKVKAKIAVCQIGIYEREIHYLLSGSDGVRNRGGLRTSRGDSSPSSFSPSTSCGSSPSTPKSTPTEIFLDMVQLVIVSQPFPTTALKSSLLKEAVTVALLLPASLKTQVLSEVEATALHSFSTEFPLKNNTQPLRTPPHIDETLRQIFHPQFFHPNPTPRQLP
jgi:hypothetical protein